MISSNDHLNHQDEQFDEQFLIDLEAILHKKNQGRNLECWAWYSFGWKDADLEPEGCTGVKSISFCGNQTGGKYRLNVVVGGHKVLCDPTYECEYELTPDDEQYFSSVAHEIVSDAKLGSWAWEGDCWRLGFEDSFIVNSDGGSLDALADEIIETARQKLKPFEEDMKRLDGKMNKLFQEMNKKYGSK